MNFNLKISGFFYKTASVVGVGLVILSLFFPLITYAETVVRTGDSVSINSNQVVEADFYAAGGSVTHSGNVVGDIYAVAGSVTMNGAVGEDLTAAGGTVQVNSDVNDDLRVIGGEVVISGKVKGDVFVIAGLLKILSTADIDGGVYFYGGEAEIEGQVGGSLMGSAQSVLINGEVGGVDLTVLNLSLGENALIGGDLNYTSIKEVERSLGSEVLGETIQNTSAEESDRGGNGTLVFMFVWVFTTLSFFLLFRTPVERLLFEIKKDPTRTGLVGLGISVGAPILGLVLLATVLGAFIGVVVLIFTVLLFLVALILMPIILGGYLSGHLFRGRRTDVYAVALGILAIVISTYIPFIGTLFLAIVFLAVLGSLGQLVYKTVRQII